MKLILRQYLSDLRERDELDAILPDLLSELGYNVLSRPSRGTRQAGVDVAAVGPDQDDGGDQKLFLFTVKAGDLHRGDWDSRSPQAVRPSLNEIVDSYIPARVAKQYQQLKIVICLCLGGEMKENVQIQWKGYVENNSTEKISFRLWNGDKIASLLLVGVLRQELLEPRFRADFQKSVAMVDYPDISYRFFVRLVKGLLTGVDTDRIQLTRLRQIHLCLWILFVWAREEENLAAPLEASEYAILCIWDKCRPFLGKSTADGHSRMTLLTQTIQLHLLIGDDFITHKLDPYTDKDFALSVSVKASSAVDVNLALYQQLGRCCIHGLWHHWMACIKTVHDTEHDVAAVYANKRNQILRTAIRMICTNPTLMSPIRDDFVIEIGLFMTLVQACGAEEDGSVILQQMIVRLISSINRRGAYPIPTTDYLELVAHPVSTSDTYYKEKTCASVLYPLLMFWLDEFRLEESRVSFTDCIEANLAHITQQVWVPDEATDENLWTGDTDHGKAIVGLSITSDPACYRARIQRIITDHTEFAGISTTTSGFWPILLMACRHYRMPVPPHAWKLRPQTISAGE